MAMNGQESLYQTLVKHVPDNLEWMLLFDTNKRLITDTEARRLPVSYSNSPWKNEGGAYTRITPHDAAILIVDDRRVLELFPKDTSMPKLRLAGERAEHAWRVEETLRAGIVTTGGNSPGLNEVVDSATKRLHEYRRGRSGAAPVGVYGYIGGFPGLVNGRRVALVPSRSMVDKTAGYSLKLKPGDTLVTDDFALEGCTRLKTVRGKEKNDDERKETVEKVVTAIYEDGLHILLVIGGDGSVKAARAIVKRFEERYPKKQLAVVCAVKTMDNDVVFADPSFGFFTVVDQAIDFIRRIALEAETQNRVAIIQLFGAASGFVALYAAYCSGEVDWVVLPETLPRLAAREPRDGEDEMEYVAFHPPVAKDIDDLVNKVERLKRSMIDHIQKRLTEDKKEHAVIVLAEGATPTLVEPRIASGHKHTEEFRKLKETAYQEFVSWVKKELKGRKLENEVMHSLPQHLIRATGPNGFDAALCKYIGKLAADTALGGYTDCAVAMWHGRPVLVPLHLIADQKKYVQPNGYFAASMLRKLSFTQLEDAGGGRAGMDPLP